MAREGGRIEEVVGATLNTSMRLEKGEVQGRRTKWEVGDDLGGGSPRGGGGRDCVIRVSVSGYAEPWPGAIAPAGVKPLRGWQGPSL